MLKESHSCIFCSFQHGLCLLHVIHLNVADRLFAVTCKVHEANVEVSPSTRARNGSDRAGLIFQFDLKNRHNEYLSVRTKHHFCRLDIIHNHVNPAFINSFIAVHGFYVYLSRTHGIAYFCKRAWYIGQNDGNLGNLFHRNGRQLSAKRPKMQGSMAKIPQQASK